VLHVGNLPCRRCGRRFPTLPEWEGKVKKGDQARISTLLPIGEGAGRGFGASSVPGVRALTCSCRDSLSADEGRFLTDSGLVVDGAGVGSRPVADVVGMAASFGEKSLSSLQRMPHLVKIGKLLPRKMKTTLAWSAWAFIGVHVRFKHAFLFTEVMKKMFSDEGE
jgi:hypothetical protein